MWDDVTLLLKLVSKPFLPQQKQVGRERLCKYAEKVSVSQIVGGFECQAEEYELFLMGNH